MQYQRCRISAGLHLSWEQCSGNRVPGTEFWEQSSGNSVPGTEFWEQSSGNSVPGSKIIDCGPVGPLMMDLSPSCWEGLSLSHFKEPERVIRWLEPFHCQWTKFITLQRAWSSSCWKGLSPSHIDGPKRAIYSLGSIQLERTEFISTQWTWWKHRRLCGFILH